MENQEFTPLTPEQIAEQDAINEHAIARIGAAQIAKMRKTTRAGRAGWNTEECTNDMLSILLFESLEKGDPIDVANYAMMLHARGEFVTLPSHDGQWVRCSPDLLHAGVSCANTPRRASDSGHQHFINHREPSRPLSEERRIAEDNSFNAAIQFALDDKQHGEGLTFLRLWNEGSFDAIRREWEDVPEAVFIGADTSHPETKRLMANEILPQGKPSVTPTGIVHRLRTHHAPFDAVAAGAKTCEIRINDRDYKIGDTLELFRWPESEGRPYDPVFRTISHVQQGYGLRSSDAHQWVVLSFADLVPQGKPCALLHIGEDEVGMIASATILDEPRLKLAQSSVYVYLAADTPKPE